MDNDDIIKLADKAWGKLLRYAVNGLPHCYHDSLDHMMCDWWMDLPWPREERDEALRHLLKKPEIGYFVLKTTFRFDFREEFNKALLDPEVGEKPSDTAIEDLKKECDNWRDSNDTLQKALDSTNKELDLAHNTLARLAVEWDSTNRNLRQENDALRVSRDTLILDLARTQEANRSVQEELKTIQKNTCQWAARVVCETGESTRPWNEATFKSAMFNLAAKIQAGPLDKWLEDLYELRKQDEA